MLPWALPDDAYNRLKLVGRVHPPDWANQAEPSGTTISSSIGGTGPRVWSRPPVPRGSAPGSRSSSAIFSAATVSMSVACRVEGSADPVGPSHRRRARCRRLRDRGAAGDARRFSRCHGSDEAAVMGHLLSRTIRAQPLPAALGVDVFFGSAHFTGPDSIEVGGCAYCAPAGESSPPPAPPGPTCPDERRSAIHQRHGLFGRPTCPPPSGHRAHDYDRLRAAQAFARFGSEVSLIGNHPQIMPREDRDAAGIVETALRHDNIIAPARCRGGAPTNRATTSCCIWCRAIRRERSEPMRCWSESDVLSERRMGSEVGGLPRS